MFLRKRNLLNHGRLILKIGRNARKRYKKHSGFRAKERYGVKLCQKLRNRIIYRIRTGRAKFIQNSGSHEIWIVPIRWKKKKYEFKIVYHASSFTIITVLPPEEEKPKEEL